MNRTKPSRLLPVLCLTVGVLLAGPWARHSLAQSPNPSDTPRVETDESLPTTPCFPDPPNPPRPRGPLRAISHRARL